MYTTKKGHLFWIKKRVFYIIISKYVNKNCRYFSFALLRNRQT